ncbi:MAG TPA: hypothetical protein PKC30_12260 [Saprospiraceae bacterium]|nr:hypothetical protein [Saprospiraceae bacterium]
MTTYKDFRLGGSKSPLGSFGSVIILILLFVFLYFIAKGIFTLLSYVAPVLIILALILDHTVAIDFVKFKLKLFRNNTLVGILAVLLTIVGFPVVAGFLFFRAIIRRNLKKTGAYREAPKEIYAEYEEIPEEDEDFLELPQNEKPKEEIKKKNDYDQLF